MTSCGLFQSQEDCWSVVIWNETCMKLSCKEEIPETDFSSLVSILEKVVHRFSAFLSLRIFLSFQLSFRIYSERAQCNFRIQSLSFSFFFNLLVAFLI